MDIMELGAIGELVGGVAVVGSLLYRSKEKDAEANARRPVTGLGIKTAV